MIVASATLTGTSFAQDVSSQQKKLTQISRGLERARSLLKINKKEEDVISKNILDLDKKIYMNEKETELVNLEIAGLEKEIEKLKVELIKAQEKINDKNEITSERIKIMHKYGYTGYAEMLLNSSKLVDLVNNFEMAKIIISEDLKLLRSFKIQRDLIDAKTQELEIKENAKLEFLKNLESKQSELERNIKKLNKMKQELIQNDIELELEIDEMDEYYKKLNEDIRQKQSDTKYEGGKLAWPAPGFTKITSPFGYRIHPVLKTKKLHAGIDIGMPKGSKITAAGDGKVIFSGWINGYGQTVMIDHGGKIVTLYAHNSSLEVKEGQIVKTGDVVAKAGSTGLTTGSNLHFEVRENGEYVDPINWLK